jgi:hypothetical protein
MLRTILKTSVFWMFLTGAQTSMAFDVKPIDTNHYIYGIYKSLPMGDENEVITKDFYVNVGTKQGLKAGQTLEVNRKIVTFDATSQKHQADMIVPIAKLKIIHVDSQASIARLEKMVSPEKAPAITPRAVMLGDYVRLSE